MVDKRSDVEDSSPSIKRNSQYDGVLILTLLAVILSGFVWVVIFYVDKPDK